MKSRKITIALLAIIAVGLSLTACKKTASGGNKNTLDSAQTQSNDEVMANKETDESSNDATAALENSGGSFASRPAGPAITFPCDATVSYDTAATQKSITITYNGNNCSGTRTRTGKIIISFDASLHWNDAGATINVDYDSLIIIRNSDGKKLLINGSVTHTNVSGGLLANLSSNSITRTITGNLTLTFDNGTQRIWQITKQRVFTYDNGIVVTTTGTGTGGIAEAGINRYGNTFTAAITQPVLIKQSCDFRIVGGMLLYTGPYATIATTFGLDASGNQVSACPIGFFYYKQVWSVLGRTYTFVGPY
jgi:hypothetical protein